MDVKQRVEIISSDLDALKAEVEQGGGSGDLSAYLTKDEASSTYETQTGAAATYETQSHASSTYVAKNADPLVIATYTNPTAQTNDGTANIYLGSLNNSTTDNHDNTTLGYGIGIEANTRYSVAIGNGSEIQCNKGNQVGEHNVAINGKIYGKNSVAIQGTAGFSSWAYGENKIAIAGEAEGAGNYLLSINGSIKNAGNSSSYGVAINTGTSFSLKNSSNKFVCIGQLNNTNSYAMNTVGIGHNYFNSSNGYYTRVVAVGNELLPSNADCVILGSFSKDMSSSSNFFVVGNGTNSSNRSNLVEITTPLKVSTAGIEVNGTPYGQTATSTATLPSAGTGTTFDTGIEWSYIQTKNDFILDSEGSQIKFRYGFTKGSYIHYFGYILDNLSVVRIAHLELGAPTGSGTTALATWISSGAIPTT